jgi:hypothetical protein
MLGIPIVLSVLIGVIIYFVLRQLRKRQILGIHPVLSLLIALGATLLSLYILIVVFGLGIVIY